jgi:uncharacterized protein (TIGR03790 family)
MTFININKILLFLTILCLLANLGHALEPEEILVIANKTTPKSIDIAKYYMNERKIPANNLLEVRVIEKETCSRIDYKANVAMPVRRYLEKNGSEIHIRCLVLMYGIPLKVAPPEISLEEEMEIHGLEKRKNTLRNELQNIGKEKKRFEIT